MLRRANSTEVIGESPRVKESSAVRMHDMKPCSIRIRPSIAVAIGANTP